MNNLYFTTSIQLLGCWGYFSLTEMYLNYAEAEFYANGVSATAIDAVNVVRERAGKPDLPAGVSVAEFELRHKGW